MILTCCVTFPDEKMQRSLLILDGKPNIRIMFTEKSNFKTNEFGESYRSLPVGLLEEAEINQRQTPTQMKTDVICSPGTV